MFLNQAQAGREVFYTRDGVRTGFERRPQLKPFLEATAAVFELVIFTAGSQVRPWAADPVGLRSLTPPLRCIGGGVVRRMAH